MWMTKAIGSTQRVILLVLPAAAIALPGQPRSYETLSLLVAASVLTLAGTSIARTPLAHLVVSLD